jgi:hypothetical protein
MLHRVLESLKAGKRLPEAKFETLKIASQRQDSVYGRYSNAVENGAGGSVGILHGDKPTPTPRS